MYDKIKGRILRNNETMYNDSDFNQEEFDKAIEPYINKDYNKLRKKYMSPESLQEYFGIKLNRFQRLKFNIIRLFRRN